jgi:hypothetical protein
MGCIHTKIYPKRHHMSLFEAMAKIESLYYKNKFSPNSYIHDMTKTEIKDICSKTRDIIEICNIPKEVKLWLLSRVNFYENDINKTKKSIIFII